MAFFLKLKRNYLSKMRGYPIFSFWIPIVITKIYFLRIVLNRTKISLYLKASPIGKLEYLEMRRTLVGTALKQKASLRSSDHLGELILLCIYLTIPYFVPLGVMIKTTCGLACFPGIVAEITWPWRMESIVTDYNFFLWSVIDCLKWQRTDEVATPHIRI